MNVYIQKCIGMQVQCLCYNLHYENFGSLFWYVISICMLQYFTWRLRFVCCMLQLGKFTMCASQYSFARYLSLLACYWSLFVCGSSLFVCPKSLLICYKSPPLRYSSLFVCLRFTICMSQFIICVSHSTVLNFTFHYLYVTYHYLYVAIHYLYIIARSLFVCRSSLFVYHSSLFVCCSSLFVCYSSLRVWRSSLFVCCSTLFVCHSSLFVCHSSPFCLLQITVWMLQFALTDILQRCSHPFVCKMGWRHRSLRSRKLSPCSSTCHRKTQGADACGCGGHAGKSLTSSKIFSGTPRPDDVGVCDDCRF